MEERPINSDICPRVDAWDKCQTLCSLIMYSRAYLLLERDFQELKENNFKVSAGNLEGCVSLGYEFLKAFQSVFTL